MHGHVSGVSSQAINNYSAAQTAKTSAAQEAAATRRKLLRAAEEMGSEVSSDMTEMMGQWKSSGGAVSDGGGASDGSGEAASSYSAEVASSYAGGALASVANLSGTSGGGISVWA